MSRLGRKLARVVPEYSIVPLALAVSFNLFVYNGSRLIAGNWYHYNVESPLDKLIPFWPPSAIIYLGCYLFWVVNYCLIARQSKTEVCQFFTADLISRAVCLMFYLLFPTTNVRPHVEPGGFWNQVMQVIYMVDAADNLFPSIHCLVSWLCYLGVRGKERIPVWYQRFSGVAALLVCVSTLTVKQHVIADVIAGVLLAEISFRIGKRPSAVQVYEKFVDKIHGKLFAGREQNEE